MSLLVFTGGSQFAAVGVIAAGGAAATAVANALLLAVRNGAYGLSLASLLRGPFPRRAVAAQLVIDETTAMARAQDDEHDARGAFWLTGAAVFVCWNAGTLAGALAGSGLGDPAKYGLDAMFPAAFLALLAPQLRQDGAGRGGAGGRADRGRAPPAHPGGRAGDRGEPRRARGAAEAVVSWAALLAPAGGSYALKAAGPLLLGDRTLPPTVERALALLAVPLLAALIVVQTLGPGEHIEIDARVPALGAAAICVWRGAPFLVTVIVAAVVAAGLRAL
jgi:branched-subunit amino acid transport protein